MYDKNIYENLYGYLESLMIQSNWEDEHTGDWARSLFTTLCLVCNIDADTDKCDKILCRLYYKADLKSIDVSYEEFERFMLEYIV